MYHLSHRSVNHVYPGAALTGEEGCSGRGGGDQEDAAATSRRSRTSLRTAKPIRVATAGSRLIQDPEDAGGSGGGAGPAYSSE